MESCGSIRPLDNLGRVTIPKQVRKRMNLQAGSRLEIFMSNGIMVAKRYEPNQTVEKALMDFKTIVQNDDSLTCKEAVLQVVAELEARLNEEQGQATEGEN